ncbi:hypothetical protein FQA39_LY12555 [Lamprigera yunnana]|nr:hypothetical protein FQA39_LY12555 [Lamprigera yunnana]
MESRQHRWQHFPVISPYDMKNPLFGNPFSILSNWPLEAINRNKTFDYVKPPQPKRFVPPCCLSLNIISKSLSAIEKEHSKPNKIEENLNEMTPKNKQQHPKKKRRERRRRRKKKKKNLDKAPAAAETNDIVKEQAMIPTVQCERDDSFIIFEDDPCENTFDYSLKPKPRVSSAFIYGPFKLMHFPDKKSTETDDVEAQPMLPMVQCSLESINTTETNDVEEAEDMVSTPQDDFEPISLRSRYPSECESDDSFIIFEDNPCGKSFDSSLKPNSCASTTYWFYPCDASDAFPNKKSTETDYVVEAQGLPCSTEEIVMRRRYPSECESDDSFIIFEEDSCNKSFDSSPKPNSCVSSKYWYYPYDATDVFSNKKSDHLKKYRTMTQIATWYIFCRILEFWNLTESLGE